MDDEISVVHENPLRGIQTFDTQWLWTSELSDPLLNSLGNRAYLSSIGAAGDHEPTSDRKNFTDIKHNC